MKRFILSILAIPALAISALAQETTSILDLSKVTFGDAQVDLAEQWKMALKPDEKVQVYVDGIPVDGAYYAEPRNYRSDTKFYRSPVVLLTKDVTIIGTMGVRCFGLAAGADNITITLAGVTSNLNRLTDDVLPLVPSNIHDALGLESDVSITAHDNRIHAAPFSVGSYKNVTLELAIGTENVLISSTSGLRGGDWYRIPAIEVPAPGSLTITGEGALDLSVSEDYNYAPAIGVGRNGGELGTLTIAGGTIVARGGAYAAAIGKAYSCNEGSLTGSIKITGGAVTAIAGSFGTGIGGSYCSMVKDITITGGTVVATGGSYAAGIGHGYYTSTTHWDNHKQLTVTIAGDANVTATGGYQAPGIGGGYNTPGGTIIIKDSATVEAIAGATAKFAIGAATDGTIAFNTSDARNAGDVQYDKESTKVVVIGGTLPNGDMPGTLILDLATLEETTVTVGEEYAMCLIRGTKEDLDLILPEGIILLFDATEADWNETNNEFDVKVKSISCAGEFQMANFSPSTSIRLTVGSVTGTMTMRPQDASAASYRLTVENTCEGKFNLSGACSATLPSKDNVASFSPLAKLMTTDGSYPYDFTTDWGNGTFDLSHLTQDAILPEGFTKEVKDNTLILTVPAMTTQSLTQSRKSVIDELSIRASGDITLNGINVYSHRMSPFAWLDSVSTMTLTLKGQSENLIGTSGEWAAVQVKAEQSLTVVGEASVEEGQAYPSLHVYAGNGAGIGSDEGVNAGKILIPGSYVELLCDSENGAGIGSGKAAIPAGIEINGHDGTIIIGVSLSGVGIGVGRNSPVVETLPIIAIKGGKIVATSNGGAGIGTGTDANSGADIRISGGKIFARTNIAVTEEELADFLQLPENANITVEEILPYFKPQSVAPGAAIGGGQNTTFGSIAISGGTINAGSSLAAAIGGGDQYSLYPTAAVSTQDKIVITGGTIVAHSTKAAAIGAGSVYKPSYADRAMGEITITGGDVTATTGLEDAPAIGGTKYTGVTSITVDVTPESGATINAEAIDSIGAGTSATVAPEITITQGEEVVVARIGSTYYASLDDALAAANPNDTIVLLKDIDTENYIPMFTKGEATDYVNIDINGHILRTPHLLHVEAKAHHYGTLLEEHAHKIFLTGGFGISGWQSGDPDVDYLSTTVYPTLKQAQTLKGAMTADEAKDTRSVRDGRQNNFEVYILSIYETEVTLTDDITLPAGGGTTSAFAVRMGYACEFDLAGHTIDQVSTTGMVLGVFRTAGDLILKDTQGNGKVSAGASSGYGTSGVVIMASAPSQVFLQGGLLTNKTTGKQGGAGSLNISAGATVTVDGAEIVYENGYHAAVNYGELILKSGSIEAKGTGCSYLTTYNTGYMEINMAVSGTLYTGGEGSALVTVPNIQYMGNVPEITETLAIVDNWVVAAGVAMIVGETTEAGAPITYPSIDAALATAGGKTIKLLVDASESVVVDVANVTLDLAGYTLTGNITVAETGFALGPAVTGSGTQTDPYIYGTGTLDGAVGGEVACTVNLAGTAYTTEPTPGAGLEAVDGWVIRTAPGAGEVGVSSVTVGDWVCTPTELVSADTAGTLPADAKVDLSQVSATDMTTVIAPIVTHLDNHEGVVAADNADDVMALLGGETVVTMTVAGKTEIVYVYDFGIQAIGVGGNAETRTVTITASLMEDGVAVVNRTLTGRTLEVYQDGVETSVGAVDSPTFDANGLCVIEGIAWPDDKNPVTRYTIQIIKTPLVDSSDGVEE